MLNLKCSHFTDDAAAQNKLCVVNHFEPLHRSGFKSELQSWILGPGLMRW